MGINFMSWLCGMVFGGVFFAGLNYLIGRRAYRRVVTPRRSPEDFWRENAEYIKLEGDILNSPLRKPKTHEPTTPS